MLKKIISFFMGQPQGYISPTDKFLARIRKKYPQPSNSQEQEIREYEEIARLRDGCFKNDIDTTLWRDF